MRGSRFAGTVVRGFPVPDPEALLEDANRQARLTKRPNRTNCKQRTWAAEA